MGWCLILVFGWAHPAQLEVFLSSISVSHEHCSLFYHRSVLCLFLMVPWAEHSGSAGRALNWSSHCVVSLSMTLSAVKYWFTQEDLSRHDWKIVDCVKIKKKNNDTMGWAAVYDCGISWSYSLNFYGFTRCYAWW